jgi:hypothetical protein
VRLFGRRSPACPGSSDRAPGGAGDPRNAGDSSDEEERIFPEGSYVTDGSSLFRVAHSIRDSRGALLVELEDCRTLELILCPVGAMLDLRLAAVAPATAL